MKAQYSMFVDDVDSKQVCFSIICMTLHYAQLCQTQLITLRVQHRFDDETAHIQGACLVRVQGLWCHVLSV
jgi:hypothetical protein